MGIPPPNPTPTTPIDPPLAALPPKRLHQLRQHPVVWQCEKALRAAGVSPGFKLVLGCSGGPDSTALMMVMWLLAPRHSWQVQVVCIDHGLRKEAKEEAAQVVAVAKRLGLPAQAVRVQVRKQASIQAAARTARYQALGAAAQTMQAQAVLTAHTLDDQAETVLLRLLGGAGLRGLAGIRAARPLSPELPGIRLLRPLLGIEKSALAALLELCLPLVSPLPVRDPSNFDRSYRRAAIRHDLIPALSQVSGAIQPNLARLAAQLRADADYLDGVAKSELPSVIDTDAPRLPGQIVALSLPKLHRLPQPIALRVLRLALDRPLASAPWQAVLRLAQTFHGSQSLDLPSGLAAERRYDTLYFCHRLPAPPACFQPSLPICLDGLGEHWFGGACVRLRTLLPSEQPSVDGQSRVILTLPAPGFPLGLRQVRPGDRLRLPAGHRKVSDLWTDLKVPKRERATLLVLTHNDQPLWLLGVRAGLAVEQDPRAPQIQLLAEYLPAPMPS